MAVISPTPRLVAGAAATTIPYGGVITCSTKPLSVLMGTASSGGTIAAVRHLRAYGIEVGLITGPSLSAAAWSRSGVTSYAGPPEDDEDRFLQRLISIGASNPGRILLPTSDQTAWLYALHADALSKHFRTYQPEAGAMWRILDKKLFAKAVTRAGLEVVPSWEPQSLDEVVELSSNLPYPILIKPRTHVRRRRNDKGSVANSKGELIQKFLHFIDRERVGSGKNAVVPGAQFPILQQFVDVTQEGVHSITGFLDRSGTLFVTRHAVKVYQRSYPVGVGICFESLPAAPALSAAVRRLCGELNYFGLFEVEFLHCDGRWAAIDFNPRLYNQIGLDIRRGMPLPLLACLDAAGETSGLKEAVAEACREDEEVFPVFSDGFTLRAVLMARTMTSRISREERAYWRKWIKRNAAHTVDFAADANDPMPGIIHALSEVYLGLKAFPRFLRSIPRVDALDYMEASSS